MGATTAVVSLVVAALGATATAVGQYQQAKQDQDVLEDNAKIQLRNAYRQERATRRRGQIELARQRLSIAKAGVATTGSPLEQMANNAREVELEALNTRHAGIAAYRTNIGLGNSLVKQAKRNIYIAGVAGAAQSGLTGYQLLGGSPQQGTGTQGMGLAAASSQSIYDTRRPRPFRRSY